MSLGRALRSQRNREETGDVSNAVLRTSESLERWCFPANLLRSALVSGLEKF